MMNLIEIANCIIGLQGYQHITRVHMKDIPCLEGDMILVFYAEQSVSHKCTHMYTASLGVLMYSFSKHLDVSFLFF